MGDASIVSSKSAAKIMNAPLQKFSVERKLLLAANEQLESVYLHHSDPCVALLISRNYNLLMQEQSDLMTRLNWMQKAKYWWQQYLKLSIGRRVSYVSSLHYDDLLFKRITL